MRRPGRRLRAARPARRRQVGCLEEHGRGGQARRRRPRRLGRGRPGLAPGLGLRRVGLRRVGLRGLGLRGPRATRARRPLHRRCLVSARGHRRRGVGRGRLGRGATASAPGCGGVRLGGGGRGRAVRQLDVVERAHGAPRPLDGRFGRRLGEVGRARGLDGGFGGRIGGRHGGGLGGCIGGSLGSRLLDGALLGGARLGGARLARARLARARLGGARLGGARLARTGLAGARLGGARLGLAVRGRGVGVGVGVGRARLGGPLREDDAVEGRRGAGLRCRGGRRGRRPPAGGGRARRGAGVCRLGVRRRCRARHAPGTARGRSGCVGRGRLGGCRGIGHVHGCGRLGGVVARRERDAEVRRRPRVGRGPAGGARHTAPSGLAGGVAGVVRGHAVCSWCPAAHPTPVGRRAVVARAARSGAAPDGSLGDGRLLARLRGRRAAGAPFEHPDRGTACGRGSCGLVAVRVMWPRRLRSSIAP
ncbi:pentapeptide repeat-containing protein [Xylanimonas allomyrinae]|uniref:pentapeptide repeat-containing protein n=1 Tax=Xylanimonas allomyrinae TaxID=2509459 RepID=UPI003CCC7C71